MSQFSKPLPQGRKKTSKGKRKNGTNNILTLNIENENNNQRSKLELQQSKPKNFKNYVATVNGGNINNNNYDINDNELKDTSSLSDNNYNINNNNDSDNNNLYIPPMDNNILNETKLIINNESNSNDNNNNNSNINDSNNNNSKRIRRNSWFDYNEELKKIDILSKHNIKGNWLEVPKDSDDESDSDESSDEDDEPPVTLTIRIKFTKDNPMPYLNKLTETQRQQEEIAKNLTQMGFNDYQILDAFQNVGIDVDINELIQWILGRNDPKKKNRNKDGSLFDPHTTPLPKGWERLQHDGQMYYYDQNTNKTQWRHPLDPLSQQMKMNMSQSQINMLIKKDKIDDYIFNNNNNNNINKRGSISSVTTTHSYISQYSTYSKKSYKPFDPNTPIPDGWVKAKTQDNRYYYYQESTQRTQWQHPLDPDGNFMKEKSRRRRKKSIKSAEYNPVNMAKTAEIGSGSFAGQKDSLSLSNPSIKYGYNNNSNSDDNSSDIEPIYKNGVFDPESTQLPKGWTRVFNDKNIPYYYHESNPTQTTWRYDIIIYYCILLSNMFIIYCIYIFKFIDIHWIHKIKRKKENKEVKVKLQWM